MASNALFHVEETARVAHAAHARMMRDPFQTLYLFYKPMRLEAFGDEGAPLGEGWTLAFPERLPGNLTVYGLCAWLAARTGRIPYLNER